MAAILKIIAANAAIPCKKGSRKMLKKRTRMHIPAVSAILLAFGILISQSLAKNEASAAAAGSSQGSNERFYAVQKELDPGGSMYLYLDTKDMLRGFVNKIQPLVVNPQAPPEASKIFMMVNQVIDRLGLYGIQDIGMSMTPDGEMSRTKIFLNAAEGRQKGVMALFGGDPHPCALLDRVPDDTLIFISADFDAAAAWELLRQIAQDIGGMEAISRLDQGVNELQKNTGLSVPAILPALTGEFAIAVTQEKTSRLNLADLSPSLSVNTPQLTLMIRVKNDTLYQALKQAAAQNRLTAQEVSDGKLRIAPITLPPNNIWTVSPALATDGEYVYLSSHQDYLKRIALGTGASLRSSPEFKALTAGLPTEGNGIGFVSKQAMKAVQDLIQAAQSSIPRASREDAWIQRLMTGAQKEPSGSFGVRINKPNGVQWISRSKTNSGQYLLAVAVVPIGIVVAIAVPGFLRAREVSRSRSCQENLSKIEGAKEQFALENNSKPDATPRWTDLVGTTLYLKRTPVCPGGGNYKINDLKTDPECDYHAPSWLGSSPRFQHKLE
ncbi:MAG: DUF3352 domain-containing protein [Candidatus Sumerlaeota bacterium]|nr:DUF3352 domain-containing protein [Candidatus Sumerlaeota bacterium]